MLHDREHGLHAPEDDGERMAGSDRVGPKAGYGYSPPGWAQASNVALEWHGKDTHGGGVRSLLIVHYRRGSGARPDRGAISIMRSTSRPPCSRLPISLAL